MRIVHKKPIQGLVTISEEIDVRSTISGRLAEKLAYRVGLIVVETEGQPKMGSDVRRLDSGSECPDGVDLPLRRSALDDHVRAVEPSTLFCKEAPKPVHCFGRDFKVIAMANVDVVVSEFEEDIFKHSTLVTDRQTAKRENERL